MRFSLFLPPGASAQDPAPAIYCLAGLTCTHETFAAKAGAQRVAAELGVALVACDTSPRAARYAGDGASWDFGQGAGFYLDATEAHACELVKRTQLPFELLVDQGLADKFLERELQPEHFEAACAAAGQKLRLRRHAGYDHGYYFVATVVEEHVRLHAARLT